MRTLTKSFQNFVSTFALAAVWLYTSAASAAVISVNLANQGSASYVVGGGTNYGIASQGTYVAGWLNLINTASAQKLPYSDGTASSVSMSGVTVGGNFNSYNGAYAYTPLYAGYTAYTGAANYNAITLTNLAANFPNGYKVIVYVCGYLSATADSISDGTTTYYFHPYTTAPTAPVTPTQITSTTPGTYQLGQYVVFGDSSLLTADSLTLTVKSITGGGAGICGIQIVGTTAQELGARIWSGNLDNNWDTATFNWTNIIYGATNYMEGEAVTFNDQAVAASPTVNLTAPHSPGSVTVDSTKDYTFTGSGIAGATGFAQEGSGTTTLNNANTYTGDTIISAGTLKVGNPAALPNGPGFGSVSLAAGASLDLNGVSAGINGLTGSGTVDDTGATATLTLGLNNDATTFAGTIQGATALKKQGTNAITLTGSSSHTGATTVAHGTLVLSPVSSFSGSSALVVSNGATLAMSVTNGSGLYTSENVSLNGGVALSIDFGNASATGGAVPLTMFGVLNLNGVSQIAISGNSFGIGSYTLISYGSKTGSGSISATPAALPAGMAATIQDTGSAIILNVTLPSIQTLAYTYGDGGIWATNAAVDFWNFGTAAYAEYPGGLGDTVIFGTNYNGLKLTGGTVSVNTDVHPDSITAIGNYTLTGPGKITGATGIQMAGAAGATFTLNTANTYDGVTTISSGTLQINNAGALGSTVGGTLVASGGSLAISNGITLAGEPLTLNGNGTAGNNGALRSVDSNNAVSVSSPITLGSTARISVSAGSQLIINSHITDNGSNYSLFLSDGAANTIIRMNSSSNVAGNLVVYGYRPAAGLISFGADNVFPASSLTVGGGLFDLNGTAQSFAGILAGTDATYGVITNSSASPAILTINYSGTNAAQMQSIISGPMNIVKEGSGLQSFVGGSSAVHTYTGTTTINGGILGLAADVSQVTNSWIVNSGGTLRGTSTIGGPVTVNSGGTIYSGFASNAIGTLTISNNLSLAGNTIVAINKDVAVSNDVINVSGALAYGGTLTIYNLGTNALFAGDTFTVFPPGGTGSFSSIVGDPGATWSFNDGVLMVVSVTSPAAPSLAYTTLGGGVLQFNWTGADKLQWQTNALVTGLSTNWVDYPDTNNPVNVTNDPAIPAAFFRLISQ